MSEPGDHRMKEAQVGTSDQAELIKELQAELRRLERENTQLREKLERWTVYLERRGRSGQSTTRR